MSEQPLPINPLLQAWTGAHGMPPFGRLLPEHFEPALVHAMALHKAELAEIAAQPAAPSFDNTAAAMDRCGRLLQQVSSVFETLADSATSPALQEVQRKLAVPLAAHTSAVYQDAGLFSRLDDLHQRRQTLGLETEQLRLLERLHLDFVRAGARLAPVQRNRYAQVMQDLASLTTKFAQNVLHDENSWHLNLPDEAALAGLPEDLRAAAAQAAAERGQTGHVITLSRSLVVPFLTHSTRADLREKAWRGWTSRGEHSGEHDNRPLMRDILRLRKEQAALLGHACYADHALADTMAGRREAVHKLLSNVWPRALAAVARERQELQAQMRDQGLGDQPIEAWDWRFWAERVRRSHYAVDDAEVKPYFALDNVVRAAFDCAERLFGLRFEHQPEVPVYHPDVKAYAVSDSAGRPVGLFLQDNFARPTKRSGAWMSALRWQTRNQKPGQAAQLPVILNNNNFARGMPGAPTLLSMDDARTLFHEFGHGLHGLLSNVTFDGLSGTQVLRDFVELPSQIFEHWINVPEVLHQHAIHWQTGRPMPDELLQRLHRARQFGQGFETVRYVASALIDMEVHSLTAEEPPADLCAFEAEFLQRQGLPQGVGQNHRLVHFQHLFSSASYAAGYYVYLWAEVLDADGFEAFEEAGSPFAPAVAARLKQHIYAAGNSVEPQATYRAFRGRDATVEPLLRKRGLLEPA